MTEKELQRKVMDLARTCGWHVAHFHDSRRQIPGRGMVGDTDAKGWPDLVLVHSMSGRVLFRELKSDSRKAKVTADQQTWINVLKSAGLDADVWRPGDWETTIIPALTLQRKAA